MKHLLILILLVLCPCAVKAENPCDCPTSEDVAELVIKAQTDTTKMYQPGIDYYGDAIALMAQRDACVERCSTYTITRRIVQRMFDSMWNAPIEELVKSKARWDTLQAIIDIPLCAEGEHEWMKLPAIPAICAKCGLNAEQTKMLYEKP